MKGYKVVVADNYHYMDESAHYVLGIYDSGEEAVAAAKAIVDEFIDDAVKRGADLKGLYQGYVGFGEDPFIVPLGKSPPVSFSAWDYAKERCEALLVAAAKEEPEANQ